MARTNATNVATVIDVAAGDDLTVFINTASEIVDAQIADDAHVTDATVLELIERWLAAHTYAVYNQQGSQERAGKVSITYQGKTGMHLENSKWGQMAMAVDPSGKLAAWNDSLKKGNKRTVGVTYLGSTTTSQDSAYAANN